MNDEKKQIIVRFPPSPTGFFHVGNARTFLFNYLFAGKNNGKIVFRLEDTDKERSKKEYEDDIIKNLKWLKIEPDFSTTVRQSERGDIYKKYLKKLVDDGKAYLSKEEITEVGQRSEVIRFKNPNKKIIFNDLIRGDIEFDTTDLGDFVIAKSMEEPVYHLAVVIDDFEMGVTHIIRGDDGISNTPRQILIQEAIGSPRPIYAHLPMMLAEDKTKLSKRKHGEKVSVSYYREAGYLSEALINFLAMVGWNSGTDQEIFSMQELIEKFDLAKVQKSGAIFNIAKLNWMNKEYIKKMSDEDFKGKTLEFLPDNIKNLENYSEKIFDKLLPIIKERIEKFGDIKDMVEAGELDFYFNKPNYKKEDLVWKNDTAENTKIYLEEIISRIKNIDDFTIENIKEAVWEYANEKGKGSVLWPMRYALSGKERSPDPFTLSQVLGKEEVLKRLEKAWVDL